MSTYNIFFRGEIRKMSTIYFNKKNKQTDSNKTMTPYLELFTETYKIMS